MGRVALDPQSLSVWEANIRELRSLQPLLAERLEAWTEAYGHAFEHEETPTPRGTWISGLTDDPFFQPLELPKEPWHKREREHTSVLFVYGVGAAPWLSRMVQAMPKTVITLVVLEPNLALLACLLHTTPIYAALPKGCRLSFLASVDETEEALAVNVLPMGTYAVALAKSWYHPGEAECFQKGMEALNKSLSERVIVRLQQLGNSAEDTLLGLRQIVLNAPWIVFGPSLQSLAEAFRGRPFIWVAAGPSLDKNVHLLRENGDRAVIICADTVAKKLLGMGIVPHIIVSLERVLEVHEYLERLWTEYPEETADILLVSQAVCVPELAKWPGPHIVVGKREIAVDQWVIGSVLQGGLLFSGLSVAHMGMWLAASLGASSLALIGQDLAFGEGNRTHAASTVSAEHAQAGSLTGRSFEVPALLGGTVKTSEIWLLFLRMMEQYLEQIPVPVFDCSEGGALIRGTTVKPLAEWMREHLEGKDPLPESPSARVRSAAMGPEMRRAAACRVAEEVRKALRFIEESQEKLDSLQRDIDRAAAPALSPAQRREIAFAVARKLDRYHRSNPVVEFIGQGWLAMNAVGIAQTRYLEDVAAVEKWRRVYEDVLAGHRAALDFMNIWMRYLDEAVRSVCDHWDEGYSTQPLPFYREEQEERAPLPKGADTMLPEAQALLDRLDDKDGALKAHVLLDNLIARADHKWWSHWDPRIDWKLACVLELEGRNAEAARFMCRMETRSLEVRGLPHEAAMVFLKDYARIVSSYDLCFAPDFELARACLQQALELEPEDEEARAMLLRVEQEAVRYLDRFRSWEFLPSLPKGRKKDDTMEFLIGQAGAERALAEGNVLLAFNQCWDTIKKHVLMVPRETEPYLIWLTGQIAHIREQGELPDEIASIRDEVLAWSPLFAKVGIEVAPGFLPEGFVMPELRIGWKSTGKTDCENGLPPRGVNKAEAPSSRGGEMGS